MRHFIIISILWLLAFSGAQADIPSATVSITPLNQQSWPAEYQLTLQVPAEHHAYLDAGDEQIYLPIKLELLEAPPGLTLAPVQKPTGEYDAQVKATVLRGSGNFLLQIQRSDKAIPLANLKLALHYQLCNERTNVCFRPRIAQAVLPLPIAQIPASITPAQADNSSSLSAHLVALFQAQHNNLPILFSLMFLAGVLSVATPCVYPMLPITSMFIVNRAQGVAREEKHHALAYLIGMVGTYMLLGLVAGFSGGAFNTVMQSAWVNISFAIFFAFFALALLGFYELSFMQNEVHSLDQHSARVKGLTGTWLMGSVAGLVISPCVGPIVFALLLQVADEMAAKAQALALLNQQLGFWDKLAISAQGSVMMGGFGLGVGLPFFMLSIVKFKLPKAGYWMNKVKYAFGFAILYFAYTYLEKGLGVLGVSQTATLTLACGLLSVWIAIIHCNVLTLLPEHAEPNQKMWHYCGVLTLLIGGWLIVTSLGQIPGINTAQANACPTTPPAGVQTSALIEPEAGINWYRNFAAAQKQAQQTGKPIFIDFYASWCANCVAFKAETKTNSALNQALREKAIALKLVDKEPDFEAFRENSQHRQLKIGLPYFAILTADGRLSWAGTDYTAAQTMIAELNKLAGA